MRVTTVQALRNVAWDVILDEGAQGPAHALALLNHEPTLAELEAAVQVFGLPQPNPVRK
jgi:hypothetical protein